MLPAIHQKHLSFANSPRRAFFWQFFVRSCIIQCIFINCVFLWWDYFCLDDNEGSSSDTAPLFQMAGDGRNTDDVTLPLLFLFHKEGNILLEALKEYREVEVLLSDKARDRGETPPKTYQKHEIVLQLIFFNHFFFYIKT